MSRAGRLLARLNEVNRGEKSAADALTEFYGGPMPSDDAEYEKKRAAHNAEIYKQAPALIKKMKAIKMRSEAIIRGVFDEVKEENPGDNDLRILALTKKVINGISLWSAFKDFAEGLGLVDPSDIGIYESEDDDFEDLSDEEKSAAIDAWVEKCGKPHGKKKTKKKKPGEPTEKRGNVKHFKGKKAKPFTADDAAKARAKRGKKKAKKA